MNEPISSDQIEAGQAVYSQRTLWMYDWLVLGFSNTFVWKCPTRRLLRLYNEHVSGNHLDVGVGTGYFLDRCQFPGEHPRITLLDLNENCLQATADRIRRYEPRTRRADLFEPLEFEGQERFESIAMNYVLHCLPGTIESKSIVLENLKGVLAPGGVLFGSTILSQGVQRGWMARRLMALYNSKQIFTNTADSLAGLTTSLQSHFAEVDVETAGCVAIFVARNSVC